VIDALTVLACLGVIVASAFAGADTLARKALAVAAVVAGATLLVAVVVRLVPGDPVANVLGEQAPESARQALAKELGLVDAAGAPLSSVAQTGRFVRGAATSALVVAVAPVSADAAAFIAQHGADEPRSYRTRETVREVIGRRLPATLALALAAVLVSLVLGVGLGALAATRSRAAPLAHALVLAATAVPRIFLGPLLLVVFALQLRVFPISGNDAPLAIVLPALTLGSALAALVARLLRTTLTEALAEPAVRTARAKGVAPAAIVVRHALRAALLPIVTLVGMQLGGLLAGAVVTEKIFAWPGVGLLLVESVRKLDVPVVQGIVVVVAAGAALSTLASEAVVVLLDPRLRRRA
jgi:peptide/nickel transport system permease protein